MAMQSHDLPFQIEFFGQLVIVVVVEVRPPLPVIPLNNPFRLELLEPPVNDDPLVVIVVVVLEVEEPVLLRFVDPPEIPESREPPVPITRLFPLPLGVLLFTMTRLFPERRLPPGRRLIPPRINPLFDPVVDEVVLVVVVPPV